MKFATTIATLCLAAAANAQSSVFTSCSGLTPTDLAITAFVIAPNPLCIGQQACITITGSLLHPISGPHSIMQISGKYLNTVVYTDSVDFCTALAAGGNPCTVPITTTMIKACFPIKTTAPPIPMQFKIQATNEDGHLLFCETATVAAVNCPV